MSRVALESIPSLIFHEGALTQSRRTSPIEQLSCLGPVCKVFQPAAVRCVNAGGQGIDVDWKCEADLPANLRFGEVSVSCEGWSRPGDPMVLKGSCGLEYSLVRVWSASDEPSPLEHPPGWLARAIMDPFKILFYAAWCLALLFILYHLVKSCMRPRRQETERRPHNRPPPGGWFDSSRSQWFDNTPHPDDAPPPYSKYSGASWRPGFWTGLGAGAAAASWWGRRRDAAPYTSATRQTWDWERPWSRRATPVGPYPATSSDGVLGQRRAWLSRDDRGEGTSSMSSMRSSSTWASSNVR